MKQKLLLILAGIALFFFILAVTFIWYRIFYEELGTSENKNDIANLQIQLEDNGNLVMMNDAVPVEADSPSIIPYYFSIKNIGDNDSIYKIYLDDVLENTPSTLLPTQLEYSLSLNNIEIKSGFVSDIEDNLLDTRDIASEGVNDYILKIWISADAFSTEWQGKTYNYQIRVEGGK